MLKNLLKKQNRRTASHSSNMGSGFTLIELMVATSIFMIIMLVAMGSLVLNYDAAQKSNNLNFAMDNLNFAMESMTRSIRMGTHYYCHPVEAILEGEQTRDCVTAGNSISFIPEDGSSSNRFSYIKPAGENKIQRCSNNNGCVDITSSDINIEFFDVYVKGSSIDNITEPSAYLVIKGSTTIKNQTSSFAIQTMVSQRTFEQ